jgi:CRP/FNR family transcriptional regulator
VSKIDPAISQTSLFKGLSEDQLDRIQSIAIERHYAKSDTIFWDGDEGTGFYIVSQGMVKIFKLSSDGKEQILHIYGPGQPFGEVPVFTGRNFPANAQAVKKSRLLFFPRQAFVDLITQHPSLALNMLAILSMRLRQFTVQVENLSLKEVPGRLASYLIYLSEEQTEALAEKTKKIQSVTKGHGQAVTLPISKGQLASLLGTIPETLSRIFNKMSTQGIISVQGATIVLENLEALEDLSINGRLGE